MISDLEFVQYTSAKICHDLAGALGAISNCIEFVTSEDQETQKRALDIISISSTQAIDTLKLFRQIYGIVKYPGEAELGRIKESCQTILKNKNINLEFFIPPSLQSERMPNTHTAQLMLATIAFIRSQLILGGTINVTIHPCGDHNSINIVAQGQDMKIRSDGNRIIQGKLNESEISSSNIDAYYIRRLREDLNSNIDIVEGHYKVEYIIPYHTGPGK
jgi:hypothetical protein